MTIEDDVRTLITSVQRLADLVDAGTARLVVSEASAKRVRRAVIIALLGFTIDITLTVVLFLGAQDLRHTNDRLSEIQARTSADVLCPLYSLLVGSLNPDLNRDGVVTKAERAQWVLATRDVNHDGKISPQEESTFQKTRTTVLNGYASLRCKA